MLKFFAKRKSATTSIAATNFFRSLVGGSVVDEDSAMKVAAYYRGVIYISGQIAKLPFYVKDSSNKIVNHKISHLLNKQPNKEMTAFTFKSLLAQQAINTGNGYAEIERDMQGRPIALHPLNSNYVVPERIAGELYYKIFGGDPSGNGGTIYLPANDILHIKNFHTKDGLTGEPTIRFAAESIGIALGSEKFGNALYENGAIPQGVVTIEGKMSPEAAKRFKEDWKSNYSGRKVGGIAILEQNAKYQPVVLQPDQLQFLESKKFTVPQIARFLGVPPTKLFDTDSTTYKNIEQSNMEVVIDTLDMWACNIEGEVDVKLLGEYSSFYSELDLYSVFRGDMDSRSNYYTKMMQVGALSPNEIREMEGRPGYEGGDKYYIATNNYTPSDRIDEVIDSQINKGENNSEQELNNAVTSYFVKKVGN